MGLLSADGATIDAATSGPAGATRRYHSSTETLTFLFSDVEGSTELVRRLGDAAYAGVLADHHRIVRSALDAAGGREEANQGDGFFATFTSPSAGVGAAVEIQRAMSQHSWPEGVAPRLRIGLHVGEASATEAGLVGFEVHRAARIAAVGHGGQTLLSAAAAGLVESALADGWDLRDLGAHRLKDLGRPETIFQLVVPGLADAFPPLRSLDNPDLANNLPVSLSPFVGRAREVAEVVEAVGRTRLVTLTGAGGSGKTRLALQAAAELVDDAGEGVWLVELAALTDQAKVATAILDTFSTRPDAAESPSEAIVRALRSQTLILVLDNCEHVIDEVAKVADQVLRHCPRVSLLATSREPLGVEGEEVLRIRSMSLPPEEVTGVDDVVGTDAVDLFVARARAHDRDFALSDADAVVVASICRRLDGIPLALELAAARTATMSLNDVHERLDQRFRLLTGGARNVLPRQQTLAATVAWSYDLLAESERTVLRRLTVFVDGFDLAAAESVSSSGVIESFDVDQILGSLVTKNLVGVDRERGAVRYRLLETIRQFAADQFVAHGVDEVEEGRRRHAEHYLALVEAGATPVFRGETTKWFRTFHAEWGNIRAAALYFMDTGRGADAARILAAVNPFLFMNPSADAVALLDQALAAAPDAPAAVRARVLAVRAGIWSMMREDDAEAVAYVHATMSEAAALAREAGDDVAESNILIPLTIATRQLGRPGVDALIERVTSLAQSTGDPLVEANALVARSFVADLSTPIVDVGPTALPLRQAALEKFREAGSLVDVLVTLMFLSIVTVEEEITEESVALTREVVRVAEELGARSMRNVAMGNLAIRYAVAGEEELAVPYLVEDLRWLRTTGTPPAWTGFAAMVASSIDRSRGHLVRAAELAGAVESLAPERESTQFRWSAAERRWRDGNREALRDALGEEFDRAFARGAALTPEQAIELATASCRAESLVRESLA